jgi:hypothetical protein
MSRAATGVDIAIGVARNRAAVDVACHGSAWTSRSSPRLAAVLMAPRRTRVDVARNRAAVDIACHGSAWTSRSSPRLAAVLSRRDGPASMSPRRSSGARGPRRRRIAPRPA